MGCIVLSTSTCDFDCLAYLNYQVTVFSDRIFVAFESTSCSHLLLRPVSYRIRAISPDYGKESISSLLHLTFLKQYHLTPKNVLPLHIYKPGSREQLIFCVTTYHLSGRLYGWGIKTTVVRLKPILFLAAYSTIPQNSGNSKKSGGQIFSTITVRLQTEWLASRDI